MYVAVEGCSHGELDKIYETLKFVEARQNIKIDLLLCCGDFQAVRDKIDLMCMAVPDKHKSMQDFWQYYSGKKTAPILTIFIGGNHEASNYLQELPYGGWVAPNIYYLGYAGVVQYKGLRIGGLSGIYKKHDYAKSHFEKPPYTESTKRSVYHIRKTDVFRLKQLRQPLDIMMSHDWPNGVVNHGNKEGLLRKKPFFKEDVQRNELGSTPAWSLLKELRPRYWFSGHLHVKFAAKVNHGLDINQSNPRNKNSVTRFLALDKCLPRRDFLQILKIDCPDQSAELTYDEEWLAVLRSTAELTTASMKSRLPPELLLGKADFSVDKNEMDQLLKVMNNDMKIPLNFEKDSQCEYSPENPSRKRSMDFRTNQQTISFCRKLNILDPIAVLNGSADTSFNASSASVTSEWDEIPSTIISNVSINPDEIELDDEDDDDVENAGDGPVNEDVEKAMDIKAMSENATANSCAETRSVQSQQIVTTPLRGSGKPSMKLPPPSSSTPISSRSSGSFKDVMISFDASDHSVSPVACRSSSPVAAESNEAQKVSKKRPSDTDSDSNPSVPKQKMFKRRNASLYVSHDEDSG